jgi:hypothetical protein
MVHSRPFALSDGQNLGRGPRQFGQLGQRAAQRSSKHVDALRSTAGDALHINTIIILQTWYIGYHGNQT